MTASDPSPLDPPGAQDQVQKHLQQALETEDLESKNVHIRNALQYEATKGAGGTTNTALEEPTLYVCKACGNGVSGVERGSDCPACHGRLLDTTVPHD